MKVKNHWWIFFLLLLSACKDRSSSTADDNGGAQLFHLLEPAKTGINFVNEVVDEEKFNILTYRNFYNGGGVAIGDINNDGLPDIYFTANQQKNRLYLNRGNLQFEDITGKAGVGGTMAWSTGVTMADVNGDGWLDIYVCNSGDVDGNRKKNELFINKGNLTFTEEAQAYNLDNEGFSTHAAFFDYDNDGDLDCYILNNSFRDPSRIELYKKVRETPSPGGHKLMRNDGNTFTDVTLEAGIYSSDIAFGLGVAVSDLNGDHLPDLYVSNDFWERDYLYINKGNGKFTEDLPARVNYCSLASMGADVADINNDGAPEIFSTDMLSADNYRQKTTMSFDPYHLEDMKYRANFHYQFTQNCLHLNDGTANFSEVALLSGVSATDWSWGALIFDFENDGNKDIFVSNGIARDIGSMDFIEFYGNQQQAARYASSKTDYRKLIATMPSTPLQNYAFVNGGHLKFRNKAASLGLSQASFSNGAAYGDLDNDGDPDLVVNNLNASSFIYRNDAVNETGHHFLKVKFTGPGKNGFGIGCEVRIMAKNGLQALQNYNTRGFQSSIEPHLLFGLGSTATIDTLQVFWPDGKTQILTKLKADQTITLRYTDAVHGSETAQPQPAALYAEVSGQLLNQPAVHHEDRYNDFDVEILLPRMLSTEGPRLVQGDVNNDRLTDFILLGAAGDAEKLYLQTPDGKFAFKPVPAFGKNAGTFESTCGALVDFDRDGDLDLLIGSGGNEIEMEKTNFIVRAYINEGAGNFGIAPAAAPRVIGNFSTMIADDFDRDGDADLFLGARLVPGNYGLRPRSYLLRNDNGAWTDVATPELASIGMVTDASWTDTDGDDDNDLVVVGDWMPITVFKNDGGLLQAPAPVLGSSGWWTRIKAADLDGDGDKDFVVGNWGLNTKFQASAERPLTMYVKDFDNNGKSECIINWYPPLDTTAYPFATKPELTSQLPVLRKQILKYADYGTKTYGNLFSADMQNGALRYEAVNLQSAVLWNNNGVFDLQALPVEAQFSPVFGIVADDLDGDGATDIWLGGNFYALKPQAGRHNASKGIFLKGNNKKTFAWLPPRQSGILVEGEVRDASTIDVKGTKQVIVGRNNAGVLLFRKR